MHRILLAESGRFRLHSSTHVSLKETGAIGHGWVASWSNPPEQDWGHMAIHSPTDAEVEAFAARRGFVAVPGAVYRTRGCVFMRLEPVA